MRARLRLPPPVKPHGSFIEGQAVEEVRARSHTKPESSRVMYVEVSDEAARSAGSFAINPFPR